jgi:phosphocarrier protein
MTEAEAVIKNQLGLHVRSASKFVRAAARFQSEIMVSNDGLEVNGKSIMGVMMLAAESGSTIKIRAAGPDEAEAVAALKALVDARFELDEP